MKANIPFSVAMSVYKNDVPEYFSRSIESILEKQTIQPNEIVLVVDGPVSDEIDMIIEKYQAEYKVFKVIRLANNQGLGNALRIALENCSNELVARMDSDDVAVNNCFEQQLAFFNNNPTTDILGGNIVEFIGEEKNVISLRNVPDKHDEILHYMKKRCPFNHMTVMYKKSAVLQSGGYKALFWNEDYYLWIRMAINKCNMANTGSVLVNVRTGENMYQRRGGWKYFESEKFLQEYMLEKKMINFVMYYENILKRFIIQIVLPNKVRGWVFQKFARQKLK